MSNEGVSYGFDGCECERNVNECWDWLRSRSWSG